VEARDPQVHRGGRMMTLLRICYQGFRNALAARIAYRGDFLISIFLVFIVEFIIPFVTILIYRSGAAFPGWNLYEVLLIQGVFLLAKGIAAPTVSGIVYNTLSRVREGTFDLLLIKPRSALLMCIVTGYDTEDIGKLVGGSVLFTVALSHLPTPGALQWLQFGLLFLLSLLVYFSFILFFSGIVFQWIGNSRVFEIFDCITAFGLYPSNIFSRTIQTIILGVIPVAMIGFFPAAVLLGKPSPGILISVVMSILFWIVSLKFWNFMLGKYTSAGG
jgi:ABC-2 type transport system permease protein